MCLTGIVMSCGDQQFGKLQVSNVDTAKVKLDAIKVEKRPEIQTIQKPVKAEDNIPRTLPCCDYNHGEPDGPIFLPEAPEMDLAAMFQTIEPKRQIQMIDPSKDTVLTFEQGTKIKIPANSLIGKNGQPLMTSNVKIEVGEYYELGDLLASNLSTQTEDGLLETGGTIFISATAVGQECQLKKGASIEVTFPTEDKKIRDGIVQRKCGCRSGCLGACR